VCLRCLSDFGLGSLQQNAATAHLDLSRATPSAYFTLLVHSIVDALQRDWFNLSPQAPLQIAAIILGLIALYVLLRRVVRPATAAATVLVLTPFVPLVAIGAACAVLLVRGSGRG
jgi:uncharacterized membrane protein